MKIVLQKNHHSNGVLHLAGETIDVTKEEYDFIMNHYVSERGEQVKTEAQAKAKLNAIGELTPQQEKEAEAIGKKV